MTNDYQILFNKSLQQCRQLGACGGRAYGRNRRLRRLLHGQHPPILGKPDRSLETAAEAIAALDAQFPWLRGAERRKQPQPSLVSVQ